MRRYLSVPQWLRWTLSYPMVTWVVELSQLKHRGVQQQYLSGRPSIHRRLRLHGCWFRPTSNYTCFGFRLPTIVPTSSVKPIQVAGILPFVTQIHPAYSGANDRVGSRIPTRWTGLTLFTGADPSSDLVQTGGNRIQEQAGAANSPTRSASEHRCRGSFVA